MKKYFTIKIGIIHIFVTFLGDSYCKRAKNCTEEEDACIERCINKPQL